MRTFNVSLQIRTGKESENKNVPVPFEGPIERGPYRTLCSLATQTVERELYGSENFKKLGKNWRILHVYEVIDE